VGEPPRLFGERLGFSRLELQRPQLLHLVAQELELRVAIARLALERKRAIEELEPHPVRDADLADGRRKGTVAIEQLALRGAAGEGLKLMLAVDIDQDA